MSLAEKALEALDGRSNLQKEVRDIIDSYKGDNPDNYKDYALIDIAEQVSEFKADAMAKCTVEPGVVSKEDNKKINNVINDISRITREILGHSIVLKSRKGGYVYGYKEAEPRKPKSPRPKCEDDASMTEVVLTDRVISLEGEIRNLKEAINDPDLHMLERIIRACTEKYGPVETSKAVVKTIKDHC